MRLWRNTGSMTATRAAIYARISSDPEGTTLGVQRQLEDCRRILAERGYVLADEYVALRS